ncbi:Uncharacterised protein [Vibrio cholerae]|nr:Uncharacterised protein [Vibrio cholerae]
MEASNCCALTVCTSCLCCALSACWPGSMITASIHGQSSANAAVYFGTSAVI